MTTEQERYTGQVKFFSRDRGFGFIRRLQDDKDFFVHYQDICSNDSSWNILFQGEYVEFVIRDGPNGEQAGNVTGINNGTLLCDNHFNPQNINRKNKNKHKSKDNTETELNLETNNKDITSETTMEN